MKKIITQSELATLIGEQKSATFATVILETIPKMNKKENPFYDNVVKSSIYNVCINFDYENAVNRQRNREGAIADFVAQEGWGEKDGKSLIILEGKYYLQFKLEKKLESRYFDKQGNEIQLSQIADFLPKKNGNAKQQVEKEIIVLRPKFESIKGINMNGNEYIVKGK